MATDVKLDQEDGTFIVLEGRVVKAVGSDFMLDSPERRKGGGSFRRALTHNKNDGLDVNHLGDYPGGLTLVGVVEIIPQRQPGTNPIQPSSLVVQGDISFLTPAKSLEIPAPGTGSSNVMVPTSLNQEITSLQAQIKKLSDQMATLLNE
jgi:hypothetical protein